MQSDLKRAISSAYYALFHCLSKCCADTLVGDKPSSRSQEAWQQVYRSVDHKPAKKACQHDVIQRFPKEIQDFANQFAQTQTKRHEADYNPGSVFATSDVLVTIASAEAAIKDFKKAAKKDKRAFAVWILLKSRQS